MNLKLQKMVVSNFKGLKEFTFEPNGKRCSIYGANGLGKSSLLLAFQSLLGYGNSEQMMKDGVVVPGLDCVVSGELLVDGKKLLLSKTMREKRNKKGELTGNDYIYEVNGDTVSATEYSAALFELAGGEMELKSVTSTNYLDAVNWPSLREMVIRIAQDGQDDLDIAEKIFTITEFKDFAAQVADRRPAAYRLDKLKEKRLPLDKKISEKSGEIKGAKLLSPDANLTIPPAGNYTDLKAGRESLIRQRASLLAGDTSEIKSQIMVIQQEIQTIGTEYREKLMLAEDEKRKFEIAFQSADTKISNMQGQAKINKNSQESANNQLRELREYWSETDAEEQPVEVCNMGMKALDHPGYDAATAEKAFKGKKADTLKSITERAMQLSRTLKGFEAEAADMKQLINDICDERDMAKEAAEAVEFPPVPDYTLKQEAIKQLEEQIAAVSTPDTSRIDQQIDESKLLIEKHDEAARNLKRAVEVDEKVAELQKHLKVFVVELEGIEKGIALLTDFLAKKVEYLAAAINDKFAPLKFKIVNYLAGGGTKDCCEVMAFSEPAGTYVPLSKLSKGQMVVAKVEFLNKMQHYFRIYAPAFIDDCDGVTIPIPLLDGTQYIKLIADKAYSELTVKTEEVAV